MAAANPWRLPIAILTMAHVVGTVHIVSIMAMAPVIREALEMNVTQVGLLITGYYAAQALGALPGGNLSDRFGVGWALVVAHLLLGAGGVVFVAAGDFGGALAGTIVMGFGYSIVNPATAKGVLEWFPANRRASAMGIKQTGVPIGGVLAAGNGALVAWFDYRHILLVVVAIAAAHALLCTHLITSPQGSGVPRSTGGMNGLVKVWKERNIRLIFYASISWNLGQSSFFAYLTLFLREVAQATQPMAGVALGVAQTASAFGRIGWGVFSDRRFGGRRKALVVGMCTAAAVLLAAMALVGSGLGIATGVVLALLLGLTIASFASLAHTMAVETVPAPLAGSAMGYSLMGTSLGGMIGPPLFGVIVDATASFANAWLTTGIIVGIGTLIVGLWFRERHGDME